MSPWNIWPKCAMWSLWWSTFSSSKTPPTGSTSSAIAIPKHRGSIFIYSFNLFWGIFSIYLNCFRVVMKKDGCVNKAVFFDKDLMFLTIFGLRGYKHALESLDGLQCSAELHDLLLGKGVSLVSIGVTTGNRVVFEW